MAIGIASAEIKSRLEDLLALLQQDTAQLVDDSDPAKDIFKISMAKFLPMMKRCSSKRLT
jgi:hypothetical protein